MHRPKSSSFAVLVSWSTLLLAGCGIESSTDSKTADVSGSTASVQGNSANIESKNPESKGTDAGSGSVDRGQTPKTGETAAVAEPEKPAAVIPRDLGSEKPQAAVQPNTDGVTLTPAKWTEYLEYVKPKNGKKFTLVDAWATWCAPCKENFPHVVEMNERYGPKGLQVISLSMDDVSDSKAVKEATDFLVSQKAVFTNLIMNESQDEAFDKLEISAIPSVFLFDAEGKEVHRFTLEDPNDQFTYEQVEQAVQALLDGKPLPDFKKTEAKK